MRMARKVRGMGFKFTLSAVLPFSILWFVVVVVVAAPVLTTAVVVSNLSQEPLRREIWLVLIVGMAIIITGVAALAVFTTARIAGPFVALERALEDVKNGDLNRRLSFRGGDNHLRGLENVFNEMVDTLRQRVER